MRATILSKAIILTTALRAAVGTIANGLSTASEVFLFYYPTSFIFM